MTNQHWTHYDDEKVIEVLDNNTKSLIAREAEKPFSLGGMLKGLFYLSPLGYVWDYESYRKAWIVAKVAKQES